MTGVAAARGARKFSNSDASPHLDEGIVSLIGNSILIGSPGAGFDVDATS